MAKRKKRQLTIRQRTRAAHVFYFGEALNRLYKKNPSIPKNPSEWSSNHANYEIKLLEIYGPIRGEKLIKNQPAMTDAAKRYNSLKKKL